jgi:hypothetical protein
MEMLKSSIQLDKYTMEKSKTLKNTEKDTCFLIMGKSILGNSLKATSQEMDSIMKTKLWSVKGIGWMAN